jgi:serine/threonine-protein kinase
MRALAREPADRFPTARALSDAVERFLDGDRDLAMRKEMAGVHVERALAAFERASTDGAAETAHAEAIREATRALALAPGDERASRLLARLLMEAPKQLPAEASRELEASKASIRMKVARLATIRIFGFLVAVPVMVMFGVQNWAAVAFIGVVFALSSAGNLYLWKKRGGSAEGWLGLVPFIVSGVAIACVSGAFGWFTLVPTLALLNGVLYAGQTDFQPRKSFIIAGLIPCGLPMLLEAMGVLPRSVVFEDGLIKILPRVIAYPPVPTFGVLALVSLALSTLPLVLLLKMRATMIDSERRLFLQAWHLRQFLPEEARKQVAD